MTAVLTKEDLHPAWADTHVLEAELDHFVVLPEVLKYADRIVVEDATGIRKVLRGSPERPTGPNPHDLRELPIMRGFEGMTGFDGYAVQTVAGYQTVVNGQLQPGYTQQILINRKAQDYPMFVVAAALRFPDGLIVSAPRPARHHHLMASLVFQVGKQQGLECGFILSDGTFATREQAGELALANGQIKQHRHGKPGLYSEDVW